MSCLLLERGLQSYAYGDALVLVLGVVPVWLLMHL
jgi:hypothetical protein